MKEDSYWNFRVCKRTESINSKDVCIYDIREVYYIKNDKIEAYSKDPLALEWDNREDTEKEIVKSMSWTFKKYVEALKKPVVNLDELAFKD
jgi:hypothetical protein